MSAESDLFDALRLDAGVAALVGARIYPYERPQGSALPAIVFGRTQTTPITSIHGTVLATRTMFAIDIFAEKRITAESIGDAVEGALNGSAFVRQGRAGEPVPEMEIETVSIMAEHLA